MRIIGQWRTTAVFVLTPALIFGLISNLAAVAAESPNILFIMTDDQSWRHVGCYGDSAVRTPAMDDLARRGVRFTNAYCAAPSCSPSRAAVLTGQDIFRLEEGGVLTGFIREKFDVFPLVLEQSGYSIGNTGKAYAPRTKNTPGAYDAPIGKPFNEKSVSAPKGISRNDYASNFVTFLEQVPEESPFFFWVGISEPHLPHPPGLGQETGISTESIDIPSFYPDNANIRNALSDYLAEIEWADQMIGKIIRTLKIRGLMDNTVIVFTSDNGMPFPRAKATLYEYGVHMPLIVRWDKHIASGRVFDGPVSLIDMAPTFLEIAGLGIPATMTGKSLKSDLLSHDSGRLDHKRKFVVSAFEKHCLARPHNLGFPRRALHSKDWTYIRNFEPNRYPAGHPETLIPGWGTYGDIDPSGIKTFFIENQGDTDVQRLFALGFGKVPPEELYDKRNGSDMTTNLAGDPRFHATLTDLRSKLANYLAENEDPRTHGLSPWDDYNLDRPFPISHPITKD
ncbi:Arylsulfatase [Planctomycetes bacterium CA13]|uniref:Arylsulfatase n=1 Tax=Novipirellula herctigrandis TaxID=2527986 RepID=A0A5C5ZAE3_9BACT|nr:Arylsulfatase [Planctomycetes bacterium CA13]